MDRLGVKLSGQGQGVVARAAIRVRVEGRQRPPLPVDPAGRERQRVQAHPRDRPRPPLRPPEDTVHHCLDQAREMLGLLIGAAFRRKANGDGLANQRPGHESCARIVKRSLDGGAADVDHQHERRLEGACCGMLHPIPALFAMLASMRASLIR
jgi:hypothetical protein